MSVRYRFEDDLLEIIIEGDHSVEEFFECVQAALTDEHWAGSAWLLVDISQSPAVTRRTPQEMRRAVHFLSARPGTFRGAAAVVVSSTVQDEQARLFATMADFVGSEVRSFFQRDEAVCWLRQRTSSAAPPPAGQAGLG